MHKRNDKVRVFLDELLKHPLVTQLELVDDQGVKVSTHTYDVLEVTANEITRDFGSLRRAASKIDFFAILIGIIVHDLSKGSIRINGEVMSHSQMMLKRPEYITKETETIIEETEKATGLKIKADIVKNICHIVLSHHGRWGKVRPSTREATIVHKADVYSAKYHRINPIGADDILNLMIEGLNMDEIAVKFDCTPGIIKDRLKRSKQEMVLKNNKQLLAYYKKNNRIAIGDDFFTQRIKETALLIKAVEKKGFIKLIKESPLINTLDDRRIFQK